MSRPAGREHGTRAMYVAQRGYGRSAYVDAEPVRAHLHILSTRGLGWKRAAARAGLAQSTVCKLLYGYPARGQAPPRRCRERTAAALLAVTAGLDDLGAATRVPGIGTRRRLQALAALGWCRGQLATRVDLDPGNLAKTLRSPTVTASTARAARRLYDELWDTPPPQTTPGEARAAARARGHARRHGWAPPLAWDDDTIDDPVATPAGVRSTSGRGSVDRAEVEHLASAGCHPDEIARRLGVTPGAIQTARRRAARKETA